MSHRMPPWREASKNQSGRGAPPTRCGPRPAVCTTRPIAPAATSSLARVAARTAKRSENHTERMRPVCRRTRAATSPIDRARSRQAWQPARPCHGASPGRPDPRACRARWPRARDRCDRLPARRRALRHAGRRRSSAPIRRCSSSLACSATMLAPAATKALACPKACGCASPIAPTRTPWPVELIGTNRRWAGASGASRQWPSARSHRPRPR